MNAEETALSVDESSTARPPGTRDRVDYATAGRAMRQSVERALAAKDITAADLRVLLVILAATASYSKLSDSTTRVALAEAAGVSLITVKRALARLDAVDAIAWQPVRGQGKKHSKVAIPYVSNGSMDEPLLPEETAHRMSRYESSNGSPDEPGNGSPNEPLPRSSSEKKAASSSEDNVHPINSPVGIVSSRLECSAELAAKVVAEIKRRKQAAGDPVRFPSFYGCLTDEELRDVLAYVEDPPEQPHPADSWPIYIDYSSCPPEIADDGAAYAEWCREQRHKKLLENRAQYDAKHYDRTAEARRRNIPEAWT